MWILVPLIPWKKPWNTPASGEDHRAIIPSRVVRLVTPTLPLDVESIRGSDNGIAVFLSKLTTYKEVDIAVDEEELDGESTLRIKQDDETWEVGLSEFIEAMHEKPKDMSHIELKHYLEDILWRIGVKIWFSYYSPNTTGAQVLAISDSSYPTLLQYFIVGETTEGQHFHFSIRMENNSETVWIYPEAFKEPRHTPLIFLALEYIIQTQVYPHMVHGPDTPLELLRYHQGIRQIVPMTLWQLQRHVLDMVYAYDPKYKKMNQPTVALRLFHKQFVLPLLREES